MTVDSKFMMKPDGLWRTCILCGQLFQIISTAETFRENKQGRVCEVRFGAAHPHNLMQFRCGDCQQKDDFA